MSARTDDYLRAIRYAEQCFDQWSKGGKIAGDQGEAIRKYYEALAASVTGDADPPQHLRLPQTSEVDQPLLLEWRYLYYLGGEIQEHVAANRLGVHAGHAAQSRIAARIRAIQSEMAKQNIGKPLDAELAEAAAETGAEKPGKTPAAARPNPYQTPRKAPSAEARPHLLELLLEPRSIQYLMMAGGGLLVLGLIIWLIAKGVFQDPLIIAIGLGAANLAILGGGAALLRWTRYHTAGRGIALLACLIMPLNLWFYSAQGLITLEGGGHLWIPALVCCVLYAATARIVRDPAFVYVLIGGVAMTGLLILADQHVARFWQIIPPATLLVVIGLASIHAERAFPDNDGPFGRIRFGRAFFLSGHVALAAGLLLILASRIAGWLYGPIFSHIAGFAQPAIMTHPTLQFIALVLVAASTYAYIYSDLTVQRHHVFAYLAVFTLLWSEILLVDCLPIPLNEETVVFLLALTALVINGGQALLLGEGKTPPDTTRHGPLGTRLLGVASSLGLLLATLPVALGILMYLRATYAFLHDLWPHEITWSYAAVMLLTAVACRVGAHVYRKTSEQLTSVYFFGAAAASMLTAVGALSLLGHNTWDTTAPWLMLIPIAYVVVAQFYPPNIARPLARAGHTATAIMIAAVIGAVLEITPDRLVAVVSGARTNLLLALFFAEAAVFYAIVARQSRHGLSVYLAAACASGAIWQLLDYVQLAEQWYILTFAGVGLMMLLGYRVALIDRVANTAVSMAAFRCGNTFSILAGAAGVLYTLNRLTGDSMDLTILGMLVPLIAASILATLIVSDDAWRRAYLVVAVVQALVAFLAFTVASDLSLAQKMELFSVVAGLMLLAAGHFGWYRERKEHDDTVTLALMLGAGMVVFPLGLGLLAQRFTFQPDFTGWGLFHEMGGLAIGLLLLCGGVLCRIRATTLGGGLLLAVYLLSLACFIPIPDQLQNVAVYIMVGGGALFGTAVLLSIYRDRLLALPTRIRQGQGVFRILTWR